MTTADSLVYAPVRSASLPEVRQEKLKSQSQESLQRSTRIPPRTKSPVAQTITSEPSPAPLPRSPKARVDTPTIDSNVLLPNLYQEPRIDSFAMGRTAAPGALGPSATLVRKIEGWKSTVPKPQEGVDAVNMGTRTRTDSGVRGLGLGRRSNDGIDMKEMEKSHRPRPSNQQYHLAPPASRETRQGRPSLDAHRLTLGSSVGSAGFDDMLTRINKVKFDEFKYADAATAGRKFAEKVFGELEWDKGSGGKRTMGGGLERTYGRNTNMASNQSPIIRIQHVSSAEKAKEAERRRLQLENAPSPLQHDVHASTRGILHTASSRTGKLLSFSVPEAGARPTPSAPPAVQSKHDTNPRSNVLSLQIASAPSRPDFPPSPNTFPRDSGRPLPTAPSAEGQSPYVPNPSRENSSTSTSTYNSTARSTDVASLKSRFRDLMHFPGHHKQLTPPSTPSPPRKSMDSSTPPTLGRSRSRRSVRSTNSHPVGGFRTRSRSPHPRKSLDASSRKSSDNFFEFVDELYSRADPYGFIVFYGDKTRADKIYEAAFLEKERQRCKKWRGMAGEVSVHPKVKEAERVAGEKSGLGKGKIVTAEGAGTIPLKVAVSPVFTFVKSGKFFFRLQKGVPQLWRGHVWYHLMTGYSGLYDRMTPEQIGFAEADFIEKYHEFQTQPTSFDQGIMFDIPRTFANHIWFMQRQGPGQQALFRLLKAYSLYDPELGYVHGINYLAAMLLTLMEEERAFITMVHLFHDPVQSRPFYNLRPLYTSAGLVELQEMHEKLMASHTPRLLSFFDQLGIKTAVYLSKWYRSLFLACCFMDSPNRRRRGSGEMDTDVEDTEDDLEERGKNGKRWEGILPFGVVVRCWDFWAQTGWEGIGVIGVGLLKWYEATLLTLDAPTIRTILLNGTQQSWEDDDEFTSSDELEQRRKVLESLTVDDPDRFMKMIRKMWSGRA